MDERLSPALRPICELELAAGNNISRIDTPPGTKFPFANIFEKPLHFQKKRKNLQLPDFVEEWMVEDTHYSPAGESGFKCLKTNHAIAGQMR